MPSLRRLARAMVIAVLSLGAVSAVGAATPASADTSWGCGGWCAVPSDGSGSH